MQNIGARPDGSLIQSSASNKSPYLEWRRQLI